MSDEAKTAVPAYTTYRSFLNLINDLRETGMPTHIIRSVVKGSNSGKAIMSSSLRYLGLIDEDMTPTDNLTTLVKVEQDYPKNLAKMLRERYPFLFDGSIDLANTTTEKVAEKFQDVGASGSTVSKCMAFFLAAAKEAGISVSSRVKSPLPPRSASATRKKKKTPAVTGPQEEDATNQPSPADPEGMIRIPIPLHSMDDGAILLPADMSVNEWEYAKKMANFILDNYHQEFKEDEE